MKIIIISLLSFAGIASAATLTIDIPSVDVPRIQEAFGYTYNLGRPATQTDIENAVRQYLKTVTYDYERQKNAYVPPPASFTPAPTPTPSQAVEAASPKKKK
jgi:hypothetical protein